MIERKQTGEYKDKGSKVSKRIMKWKKKTKSKRKKKVKEKDEREAKN